MFMNDQAYVLHIYEYVCTVGQWLYTHMSAYAYMNIYFCCFVLSILSIGYVSENVILFYMYIHFYLMMNLSHASSWVTHLTCMILALYSRL